jgi:heme a synthase
VVTVDLKSKNNRLLNWLIFLTFDLMLLGAAVRTMDAGLTCPDWPLCFGKAIPSYHFGVYLEFIHRAIAGVVGLLYLGFFIQVLRKQELKPLRWLAWVGLFFLVAQIIMGGLTVLKLLQASIVTLHLTLATAFLLTLFIMKKVLHYDSNARPKLVTGPWTQLFKWNLKLSLLFVFVQIVLGGLVATTYSGLVCIDFPTCNGQYFPKMQGPIAIQMYHRFGAYFLSLLLTLLYGISMLRGQKIGLKKSQKIIAAQIFMLIVTQVFVGVMNLKYLMPAYLSVFHLFLALLILLSLVRLYFSVVYRADYRDVPY